MNDERIIELFFERSEQAIKELDDKYGKVFHSLRQGWKFLAVFLYV